MHVLIIKLNFCRPTSRILDPKKTFIEEIPGLESENAFRLDRSCEKSLWNYESVYKGHISSYFLLTKNCFGGDNIKLDSKSEKTQNKTNRYFGKESRKELRAKGEFISTEDAVANKTSQYIPIKEKSSEDHGKRREEFTPAAILDQSTSLYCQGRGGGGVEEGEEGGRGRDETLERTAYYNRRLKEEPDNVALWLEFVVFQDTVFQDAR